MPSNVAVERPKSRIVGHEADENPTEPRESKRISTRRIYKCNIGDTNLVILIALAKDPKIMTMKMESIS